MSCTANQGQCPVGQTCALDGSNKGTCVPNSFVSFVPGPAMASLPSCMRIAVQHSKDGTQTAGDNAIMGKLGQPLAGAKCDGKSIIPYCQQQEFQNTSYCACQNTSVTNAECAFAPCANSLAAYRTTAQKIVSDNLAKNCPQQNICQNIISAGGSHNIIDGNQSSNCGGTVQKIMTQLKLHPMIAIIVVVLVVLLALVVASPSKKKHSPPPMGGPMGPGGLPSLANLA